MLFRRPASLSSTITLRNCVRPSAANNTLSLHALAADFPKCCWEANDGSKNITGEVFDELGGVEPYSDPPLTTWTLSPQENPAAYHWMEFNMTLDDATVAALVSPDTASGRFGVVLSSASEDGVMYIQSAESSSPPELSLQFEIEASSLARNWDPPTPAPTVSAAPTTQVVFTYQSRYSVYTPVNLADALSKWAELEAEAPTEGYCDMDLTSSWNLKNGYVCPNGRGNDFAFEVEVTFTIGSGRAGHWKFETRVDASRGGAVC